MILDSWSIRKVVDTGYSREERERRQDGGGPEKAGSHTLPGTRVEKVWGDIEEEKVRAGKDAEVIAWTKL